MHAQTRAVSPEYGAKHLQSWQRCEQAIQVVDRHWWANTVKLQRCESA